jgi:hypothetical protein
MYFKPSFLFYFLPASLVLVPLLMRRMSRDTLLGYGLLLLAPTIWVGYTRLMQVSTFRSSLAFQPLALFQHYLPDIWDASWLHNPLLLLGFVVLADFAFPHCRQHGRPDRALAPHAAHHARLAGADRPESLRTVGGRLLPGRSGWRPSIRRTWHRTKGWKLYMGCIVGLLMSAASYGEVGRQSQEPGRSLGSLGAIRLARSFRSAPSDPLRERGPAVTVCSTVAANCRGPSSRSQRRISRTG